MAKRLTETTYLESSPRVDAEQGILHGVKILGELSKNGRRYTPESMRRAVPLYEGRKNFIDHPNRTEIGEDRKFEGWAGVFRNVHYREGLGLFADDHLLKSGEHFGAIVEAATKFPNEVGFSHVADGESRMVNGEEVVESIKQVFSVDLVCDPATTAGFFESKRAKQDRTLKQVIEGLPESAPYRTFLIENMDAGYFDPSMTVPPSEENNPQNEILVAFKAVLDALLGMVQAEGDAKVAEVQAKNKEQEKAEKAEEVEKKQQPTPPPNQPVPPTVESLQKELTVMKAKAMLLESGREATDVRINAVATAPEADRKALVESWPAAEQADTLPFGNRPKTSPPIEESDTSDAYATSWQESVKKARAKSA